MTPRESLWRSVVARSERAARTGALRPIATSCELVEDGGVVFSVRVAESRARKPAERPRAGAARRDPFLPYEEDLFVADLSDTHVCLLNKYPAVAHHVLLVTRAWEDQQSALRRADFEAAWALLREVDGIAFYNAGAAAGASQRHKHLQLVPAPLGPGPERCPVEAHVLRGRADGEPCTAPALAFPHACARLPDGAGEALARCRALLARLGVTPPGRPYNLLFTREWMLAVPRSREAHRGVGVNALGFAGALFARDRAELDAVKAIGPMELLRRVSDPSTP